MSENKILFISGGTEGIGAAIAHMLCKVDPTIARENARRFNEHIIELRAPELPECMAPSFCKRRRNKGEKRRNRDNRWR